MSEEAIFLYGTDELPLPDRRLSAGALTLQLGQDGGLRNLRFGGVEALRAITFLVRTEGWGTPAPSISNLLIDQEEQRKDHFRVSYDAEVRDGEARLLYHVDVSGDFSRAAGLLEVRAIIRAQTNFSTNRTGFVVLHPLAGVAGQAISVEHVDGSIEKTQLAATINPAQPVHDIRSLTTYPQTGLSVTTRLEGDTFEMEDQRNWSDASFKTYSRPLTLPFPYVLEAGSTVYQSVTLAIDGEVPAARSTDRHPIDAPIIVRLGKQTEQSLPRIGIAVPAQHARASIESASILRDAAPNLLLAHFDPTLGHGYDELLAFKELSDAVKAPVTLEVVVPGKDDPRIELGSIADDAARAGLRPAAIAVFPKIDEKSFQPGERRPPSPELADLYAAARGAFPGVRLGGGTPAFFTELNRKHPPSDRLDYVSHGTCPIVHAADDASVMQTLETLPWIVRSAQQIAQPADYHISPVAIGARINPYGDTPSANPDNTRVGLAEIDPRQRGMFGAAWYLGYAAAVARLGIRELVFAASAGPFGLAYSRQPYAQPWFDALALPAVFPAFHVVAELAAAAGSPLIAVDVADPARLAALAWLDGNRPRLIIANLSAETQIVQLQEWPHEQIRGRRLDTDSFAQAAVGWQDFRRQESDLGTTGHLNRLTLPPYALVLIGGAE